MIIAKLLEAKGSEVATIASDATIADAVAELAEHRIGALVVSADGRHIEGILSERDIVRGLKGTDGALLSEPVSSIMSTTVYSSSPEDTTDSLMTVMTERRIRHVPIVADGELVGIVSIGDVVKARIDELEHDRKELVDYINAR